MGYDGGDSFPFDFEPNGFPFGSKLKGKCRHDHIPFNLKGNGILVFSVWAEEKLQTGRHLIMLHRTAKIDYVAVTCR